MVYDCVIIGSGVAGLTSALYLARAKKSVMIIEDSIIGGTTATLDLIENYPGFDKITGVDLVQNIIKQVMMLGVNINFLSINAIDFDKKTVKTDKIDISYKTLIIATGTSVNKLNIPSEHNFIFKGLSYCAVCDGSLYKNKKLVVITDGMSGNASVEYLSNITNDIKVIDIKNIYKSDKFEVYNNATIKSINGNSYVESLDFSIDDKLFNLSCDGIFVSLGKSTNLNLFENNIKNDGKYILSNESMHTNIKGVFVAGDIRKKELRQIITACSDGAIAATEAIKYINRNNI